MRRLFKVFAIAAMMALVGCAKVMQELKREPSTRSEDLVAAARAGDGYAAFLVYRQATSRAEQRKWVCISANLDYPEAQAELARMHWRPAGKYSSPFQRDAFRAYIWSIIAIHRRQPVERMEERLGWIITDGERWRAMVLAVSWRPDPVQCEHMEDSAYFRIARYEQIEPLPAEVLAAAEAGDARAAFVAYRHATTDAERRKWICVAANRDLREAQAEIAQLHMRSEKDQPSPFGRDEFKAYVWSVIAVHRHLPLEDTDRHLGWVIVEGERWRAMAMAVSWRPDPAQCDNMEKSAYFNIPSDGGS